MDPKATNKVPLYEINELDCIYDYGYYHYYYYDYESKKWTEIRQRF